MDKWSFQLGNKPTGSEHVQRRISGESVSHSDCIAKGVASSESVSFLLCESLFMLPLASHIHKHIFPFGIGWRTDSSTVQAWKTSRRDGSFPQVHIRLRWPEHQGFWRTRENTSKLWQLYSEHRVALFKAPSVVSSGVLSFRTSWRDWTAYALVILDSRILMGTTRTSYLFHSRGW